MDLVASNTAMIPNGRSIPMYEIQEPLEEQLKGFINCSDVSRFVSSTIQIRDEAIHSIDGATILDPLLDFRVTYWDLDDNELTPYMLSFYQQNRQNCEGES